MKKIMRRTCPYDWGDWKEVTINEVPKTIEEFDAFKYPTIFVLEVKVEINGEEFVKNVTMQNRGYGYASDDEEKNNFEVFWRVYNKF